MGSAVEHRWHEWEPETRPFTVSAPSGRFSYGRIQSCRPQTLGVCLFATQLLVGCGQQIRVQERSRYAGSSYLKTAEIGYDPTKAARIDKDTARHIGIPLELRTYSAAIRFLNPGMMVVV